MSSARILHVAETAALAAAETLLHYYGDAEIHEKDSTQNIVTQADLAAEKRIAEMILSEFPDHELLREETKFAGDVKSDHLWIVDPLDGTSNYAHRIPHFGISIAYAEQGEPQVGVVLDPVRDELFTAVRGEGAWLNGQPMRVSEPLGLSRSIVGTGFYYDRGPLMERTLDSIRDLFRVNIRGLRRIGAAALDLSWVACGRFDAFFEYQLAPWDYAAGALLVHEAGGVCRDRSGQPLTLESGSMIAACPAIIDEFSRIVAWPDENAP